MYYVHIHIFDMYNCVYYTLCPATGGQLMSRHVQPGIESPVQRPHMSRDLLSCPCCKISVQVLFKGQPAVQVVLGENQVTRGGNNAVDDEVADYIDALYISPNEAFWRLMAFSIFNFSHMIRLHLHLEGQQTIVHDGTREGAQDALERNARTMLTANFQQVSHVLGLSIC